MDETHWFRYPEPAATGLMAEEWPERRLAGTGYLELQFLSRTDYFEPCRYYPWRQLEIRGCERIASSHLHRHRLTLGNGGAATLEQATPIGGVAIGRREFERAWQESMAATAAAWQELADSLPPGSWVTGETYRFYPQGVLVDFGREFLGCIPHPAYQRFGRQPELLQVEIPVTCRVLEHDHRDQWVWLEPESVAGRERPAGAGGTRPIPGRAP